jgi:hypothetical protein
MTCRPLGRGHRVRLDVADEEQQPDTFERLRNWRVIFVQARRLTLCREAIEKLALAVLHRTSALPPIVVSDCVDREDPTADDRYIK